MAKTVLTKDDFFKFKEIVENNRGENQMGFRQITRLEIKSDFERKGLVSLKPKKGREIGFIFSANGLDVRIWTTFLVDDLTPRPSDFGWVLITNGDKAEYYAHPFRRTKNFFTNILRYAWICRWKILHRPLCPKCHGYMDITRTKHLKARYWSCKNKAHAGEKFREDWDCSLTVGSKTQKFLDKQRKIRHKYNAKRRKAGKEINVAMRKRRMWVVTRPENFK